jgi:hypothetical protein
VFKKKKNKCGLRERRKLEELNIIVGRKVATEFI